jgi:hypothetical protein
MKQKAGEDLLHLLDDSTRLREALPAEPHLERLEQRIRQGLLPRFALPEGFDEDPAGRVELPDYSDPLVHVLGVDSYVDSALRQLQQVDPDKYEQARQNPFFAHLRVETRCRLFAEQMHGQDEADVQNLLGARRWSALVELLRSQVEGSEWWTLREAIHLFLAYWGLGNEELLQACAQKATERFWRLLAHERPGWGEVQIMAVVLWKIGEWDNARSLLNVLDELVTWFDGKQIFSYWHCAWVVGKRFKEDCDLIRQLFNGATISPPFLENEPAFR